MSNDGGPDHPWSKLSEVMSENKVESRTSSGSAKNAGAPVKAGDTLMLRNGYHGFLSFSDYYNADTVTVMAAPGQTPRLGYVAIQSAAKWRLQGLTVSPSFLPTYSRRALISILGSRDILVESNTAYSVLDAETRWSSADWNNLACNGLYAYSSTRVTARGNHFKKVDFGMETGAHGLMEYNVVENFAGDGARCNGDSTVCNTIPSKTAST